ncbi:MAG: hypothetical protein HY293_13765 [Planctomycetes bacterium]|nr:hypothetical protein [Planctomycetota bacterium]
MTLKRCPSCRTLCDPGVDVRCFACGGELGKAGSVDPLRNSAVLLETRKDRKRFVLLLLLLAVLDGAGTLSVIVHPTVEPVALKVGFGVFLLAALVLGALALSGRPGTEAAIVGKALIKLFAFIGILFVGGVGLLFALGIWIFISCARQGGGWP